MKMRVLFNNQTNGRQETMRLSKFPDQFQFLLMMIHTIQTGFKEIEGGKKLLGQIRNY